MDINKVDALIKLNVGGTLYYTASGTLMRLPYFKKILYSGTWDDGLLEKDVGFIDRDGVLFGNILYYLRCNEVFTDDLEELLNEALFYQSKELVNFIENMLEEKEDQTKRDYKLMDLNELSALSSLSENQEDVAVQPLYQNYDLIAVVSYREFQWGCVLHNRLLYECQRDNWQDCDHRTQPAGVNQVQKVLVVSKKGVN